MSSLSFFFFLTKKNGKMQLKRRITILKIKVECRSNQNKSHSCTFDRNFDKAYSERLISRAVLCVFGAQSIILCNLKHRLNVKLTNSILRHYACYRDTIITINDHFTNFKIFSRKDSYRCNSDNHLKKVINVYWNAYTFALCLRTTERGWFLRWKFYCRRNFKRHCESYFLQKLAKLALNAAWFPFTSDKTSLNNVNNFRFSRNHKDQIDFVKRPRLVIMHRRHHPKKGLHRELSLQFCWF